MNYKLTEHKTPYEIAQGLIQIHNNVNLHVETPMRSIINEWCKHHGEDDRQAIEKAVSDIHVMSVRSFN